MRFKILVLFVILTTLTIFLQNSVLAEFKIVLNFDDGYNGVYQNAFPIMQSRGIPGVLFMITAKINKSKHLSLEQLIELKNAGWEIGSHTVNHFNLKEAYEEVIYREITNSKNHLLEGKIIDNSYASFASPMTVWNNNIEKVVQQHYQMARNRHLLLAESMEVINTISKVVLKTTKIDQIKCWIAEAMEQQLPLILILHEVADGGNEYFFPPDQFAKMLDLSDPEDFITFQDLYYEIKKD